MPVCRSDSHAEAEPADEPRGCEHVLGLFLAGARVSTSGGPPTPTYTHNHTNTCSVHCRASTTVNYGLRYYLTHVHGTTRRQTRPCHTPRTPPVRHPLHPHTTDIRQCSPPTVHTLPCTTSHHERALNAATRFAVQRSGIEANLIVNLALTVPSGATPMFHKCPCPRGAALTHPCPTSACEGSLTLPRPTSAHICDLRRHKPRVLIDWWSVVDKSLSARAGDDPHVGPRDAGRVPPHEWLLEPHAQVGQCRRRLCVGQGPLQDRPEDQVRAVWLFCVVVL